MTRTNVDLDDALVVDGLKTTGLKTRKALIHHALEELLRHEMQLKIRELRGKIRWEGNLRKMRAERKLG